MDNAYKRMRPSLGTFVEIGTTKQINAERATSAAFEAIEMVHNLLSFHNTESDISKLNRSSGEAVSLHPLSIRVLKLAKIVTSKSEGLFNCTLGGKLQRMKVLPGECTAQILDAGNATDIDIQDNKVRLRKPIRITLDGIAKGYAVDLAIGKLKSFGITSGWVNAGGDLRVYGNFVLPIQRREVNGTFISLGGLKDLAIATSSVCNELVDYFPGRIIASDSKSPELGAWSVLAKHAWLADALTKVASLASPHNRKEIINDLNGQLVEKP